MKKSDPKKSDLGSSDINEQKFAPTEDIAHREIEGQILLLLPGESSLYTFNKAGSFIWKRILKKQTVSQIARNLAREFAIDEQRAVTDVCKIIRGLEKKGVLIRI